MSHEFMNEILKTHLSKQCCVKTMLPMIDSRPS